MPETPAHDFCNHIEGDAGFQHSCAAGVAQVMKPAADIRSINLMSTAAIKLLFGCHSIRGEIDFCFSNTSSHGYCASPPFHVTG